MLGKSTISMAIFQFAFCMLTRPGIQVEFTQIFPTDTPSEVVEVLMALHEDALRGAARLL